MTKNNTITPWSNRVW